MPEKTKSFLLDQCARYPALRPRDLLKALHQSVFGCGHFVTDEAAGLACLREELPQAARDYVELVEKAIGCHIGYVSVGPERDSIIIR